ncbi:hypothetical protein AM231_15025 [Paenibacillus solani]|uniref:Uncharacterized protein n=1 Tax=Paenibacillus solani TaxID=1705565 RepID=A0A0M1P7B8_9BACL|nr:hypothetical protein AM231_15025 [Paenibacillus solani]
MSTPTKNVLIILLLPNLKLKQDTNTTTPIPDEIIPHKLTASRWDPASLPKKSNEIISVIYKMPKRILIIDVTIKLTVT